MPSWWPTWSVAKYLGVAPHVVAEGGEVWLHRCLVAMAAENRRDRANQSWAQGGHRV